MLNHKVVVGDTKGGNRDKTTTNLHARTQTTQIY